MFRSADCNICCHFPQCSYSQHGRSGLFSCHPLLNPFEHTMLSRSSTLDLKQQELPGLAKTSKHVSDEQDQ